MAPQIVLPADKPHMAEAWERMQSLIDRARAGDPEAHKVLTFPQRYGQNRNPDPRLFSRDPEEIRSYWSGLLEAR